MKDPTFSAILAKAQTVIAGLETLHLNFEATTLKKAVDDFDFDAVDKEVKSARRKNLSSHPEKETDSVTPEAKDILNDKGFPEDKKNTLDESAKKVVADFKNSVGAKNPSAAYATGNEENPAKAVPHAINSYGNHWQFARKLGHGTGEDFKDSGLVAVNTHKYGSDTEQLGSRVHRELHNEYGQENLIRVNHPDYIKSAKIIHGGTDAIHAHLLDARDNHPDLNSRAQAHEDLEKLQRRGLIKPGSFPSTQESKGDSRFGMDAEANKAKRLDGYSRFASQLGLEIKTDQAGRKSMGSMGPNVINPTTGGKKEEGPIEQQVVHDMGHGISNTNVGNTLAETQDIIGKPGTHFFMDDPTKSKKRRLEGSMEQTEKFTKQFKNLPQPAPGYSRNEAGKKVITKNPAKGRISNEVTSQYSEATIARRSGNEVFRVKPHLPARTETKAGTLRPPSAQERALHVGRNMVELAHSGIADFKSPDKSLTVHNNPNSLINMRALGAPKMALKEAYNRYKKGLIKAEIMIRVLENAGYLDEVAPLRKSIDRMRENLEVLEKGWSSSKKYGIKTDWNTHTPEDQKSAHHKAMEAAVRAVEEKIKPVNQGPKPKKKKQTICPKTGVVTDVESPADKTSETKGNEDAND